MDNYSDKYIIARIINTKFDFTDLNPRLFPQLIHGTGLYCPFHENSHKGTLHARIYYSDDEDMFYIRCYVENKNFYASDYVEQILCKEKQLFRSPKDFLLSRLSKEEFENLYNIYYKQKEDWTVSQFKKKCDYIDNTYGETGNVIDYIERLYTA